MTEPLPIPLPEPQLTDRRFGLRPWRLADAGSLVAAWADPEIARWTAVPPDPSRATAERWIAGDSARRERGLSLDLVIDADGEVAGEVGLAGIDFRARRAEMGWWIGPTHRGRGLAAPAAKLLAEWALSELSLDLLVARCAEGNPAAGQVARMAGFRLRGADDGIGLWTFELEGPARV